MKEPDDVDEGSFAAVREPEPDRPAEQWILEDVEVAARGAVRRGARSSSAAAGSVRSKGSRGDDGAPRSSAEPSTPSRKKRSDRFDGAVSPQRAARLEVRLDEGARAFRREHYADAVSILRPMLKEAPGVIEVRELLGLSYYRLGRWKEAFRELSKFAETTGSVEQHPVLADCARALGRYGDVERYWDELREVSPGADLVAEGRIVTAGAMADRGRIADAVRLMEAGRKKVKHPVERHLRMAYVLADLQERAGDVPAARSTFEWLAAQDPSFGDVVDRIAALY